jgi:hypothetical protein
VYKNGEVRTAHFALTAHNAVFLFDYFNLFQLADSQYFFRAELDADATTFATIGVNFQTHFCSPLSSF